MSEKNKSIQDKLNELKQLRKFIYEDSKNNNGVMIYNKVEFLGQGENTGKELYRVLEEYSVEENRTELREFFYEYENDFPKLIAVRNERTLGDIIPTEYPGEEGSDKDVWDAELLDIERCLEENEKELKVLAKELGIDEKDINCLSEIDLEQKVEIKGKENQEEKEQERDENEPQKISEEKLKESGQIGLNEVKLNAQVDVNGTTLGEVLKLEGYTKIMVVHSYKLPELTNSEGERGKKYIEKYALIAQKADGTYETIPQLEPDRGENNKITEINNKDNAETKRVDNRFKVPESDYSIAVDAKDPYNIPNIYLSRNTPNNDGQFAQRLQDKYDGTESTDIEVRKNFDTYRGLYMPKEAIKEARKHPEECEKGVEEVDGDVNTGHVHFDSQDIEQQKAIEEIIEKSGSSPNYRISREEAERLFATNLEARENQKEGQERIENAKDMAIEEINEQARGYRGGKRDN